MTQATRELLKRVLELPPEERAFLLREISASLEDEQLDAVDPELIAELRRRAARADGPGIPAEEALAEVERRLRERPL